MASSSSSSVATATSLVPVFPDVSLKREPTCAPVQRNKKSQKTTGRRGRKKESLLVCETVHNQVGFDSSDSEVCCGTTDTSLKGNSNHKRNSSVIKSPERSEKEEKKATAKRTRSVNADSHCPPSKRKRSSSHSESKTEIPSGSRKRPRKKLESVDSASSGAESTKRKKTKSKASPLAKNASDDSVKSSKRKGRSRTKNSEFRESAAFSDSDSSPTRLTGTRRRHRNRGKSKLQHLDTEHLSNGIVQPLKGTAETICVPSNHLPSLPLFPDFARLTAMASEG